MQRSKGCLEKLQRMNQTMRHQEPDRVPVSDAFWGSFLQRWKQELDLPADTDIYSYYDLDYVITIPNMDPWIRDFEIIKETQDEVVVRTGYGAIIRKKFSDPMPAFLSFDTDSLDKLQSLSFDDPWDDRRFFSAGDNQIAGVGDGYARNIPAWYDTVKFRYPDIPVYGSICEGHEHLWRIIGSENMMLWIGLYPEELGSCIEKVGQYLVELTKAQIQAAGGLLDGMVIWGDVAYVNGMLFSPEYWRKWFKPIVQKQVAACHDAQIPVIYHGCGNPMAIFQDYIDMGVDCYNPLEAKAGLDVVELRERFGHSISFSGNMDVLQWAEAPIEQVHATIMRKLNAAKGGGYIFQSDHSVPGNVSAERYEYAINLVRSKGSYPLDLGEFDIASMK